MSNTDFHRTLQMKGYEGCREKPTVTLATFDSNKYLNLILNSRNPCLSVADAKKLRDELNSIYPVEAPAPAPAVPKTAPAFKVGDYVKLTSESYGGQKGDVHKVIKAEPYLGNNWLWLEGLRSKHSVDGSFPAYNFVAAERPSEGRYIVASTDFDGTLSPSRNPFLHLTYDEALTEAQRLAKAHGGEFRVLKEVAAASRPAVVIPPVSVRTI